MSLLVRKINKAKWYSESKKYQLPACADSITLCLKTSKNTLSFWRIDKEAEVEEAVLAIAASNHSLDAIDIVVIPTELLEQRGFKIQSTAGDTACKDLIDSHRDLAELTVKDLDALSEMIVSELNGNKVKRYTMLTLKNMIIKAVEDGRIAVDDLKEGVKNKICPESVSMEESGPMDAPA